MNKKFTKNSRDQGSRSIKTIPSKLDFHEGHSQSLKKISLLSDQKKSIKAHEIVRDKGRVATSENSSL